MRFTALQIVLGAIAACLLLGGCAPQQQQSMTTEQALTPAPGQPLSVPPGARLVAYGHYPNAQFVLPAEGGMVYVYDTDANRVVFVNTYPPTTSAKSVDLTELSKNTLDPTHNYRVYYLPASQTTPPATQPSGAGQY